MHTHKCDRVIYLSSKGITTQTRTSNPATRNLQPETRNPKPETRNPKSRFCCQPPPKVRLARPLPIDAVLRRRSLAHTQALLEHALRLSPHALAPSLIHGVFLFHWQVLLYIRV
jgi:hypothetical protein